MLRELQPELVNCTRDGVENLNSVSLLSVRLINNGEVTYSGAHAVTEAMGATASSSQKQLNRQKRLGEPLVKASNARCVLRKYRLWRASVGRRVERHRGRQLRLSIHALSDREPGLGSSRRPAGLRERDRETERR